MIIIITPLKGTSQDFLQFPYWAVNFLQHVFSSGLGAMSPARILKWPGCNVSSTYSQVAWVQCLQHVFSSGLGAMSPARILKWPGCSHCESRTAHQALIMCSMSCAIWCEGTVQLLSLTELKLHSFWLFVYLLKPLTDKEGTKLEYSEKTPDDKLQKMPHTKDQKLNPNQDLNPRFGIGGRLGKQTCYPLHHTPL